MEGTIIDDFTEVATCTESIVRTKQLKRREEKKKTNPNFCLFVSYLFFYFLSLFFYFIYFIFNYPFLFLCVDAHHKDKSASLLHRTYTQIHDCENQPWASFVELFEKHQQQHQQQHQQKKKKPRQHSSIGGGSSGATDDGGSGGGGGDSEVAISPGRSILLLVVVASKASLTTVKYLCGVARGTPPLSSNWVSRCVKERALCPAQSFARPNGKVLALDGARRADEVRYDKRSLRGYLLQPLH